LTAALENKRRVFESKIKPEKKMEQVATENIRTTTQSGISSMLEPPFTECSSSFDSFSPDYQLETEMFHDNECQVDLGDSPVHDYLLDQDIGRVALQLSPYLPLCQRVPYKEMPNFGIGRIGQSRPLLSVSEAMECEEVGASHADSPPQVTPETAAASPQGTPLPKPSSPVHPEENATPPADDPPSGEDPQLKEEPAYQQLALPQILTERLHWTTAETSLKIENDCGEAGNRKCRQCGRKFSTTRRL